MPVTQAQATINGKPLVFETGKYAKQAGGAVTVRYGDTIVFAAATVAKTIRPGIDFFPLTVDFEERLYAAGKIPGSFPRREGRPSEEGILTARLTDRPIRPLFPKGFKNDVQIVASAWSADQENDYDVLVVNAASAALTISDAPFEGPIGCVRVGTVGGKLTLNPTIQQMDESDLDLIVAGTRDSIMMIEAGARQVTGWEQFRGLIRDNAGGEAVIGYERDGEPMTGTTNTTVQARPTSNTDLTLTQVGFLGVTSVSHVVVTHGGPLYTLEQMGSMTKDTVTALVNLPVKVWGVAKAIVGLEDRAADSPISIVGGGRIAGETVSHDDYIASEKMVFLLMLVAGFNLFIGLFNFIPLLPLDGGHIAGALYEAIRRGVAKLNGRPDPGYVDVAKLLPIAYGVAVVMLVMGVVLIVGDLVVPLHLES